MYNKSKPVSIVVALTVLLAAVFTRVIFSQGGSLIPVFVITSGPTGPCDGTYAIMNWTAQTINPCTAGSWGSTSMAGPTGPSGAAGAIGPTGPQGSTGAVGSTGATGPQGIAGPTGATGAVGATGPTGTFGALTTAEPTRTLNSCFLISSTKDAWVAYSVNISTSATLTGGQTGTVYLEHYSDSSCTLDTKEASRAVNGNSVSLAIAVTVTQDMTSPLGGVIPRNRYVKLRTQNNTGAPTFTFRSAQEVTQ